MQFKTAQQIREEREAAGKDKDREQRAKERAAERANRKYARMAEEAEKREAARKAKPKLVVNRDNVIVAPVLREQAEQANLSTVAIEHAEARQVEESDKSLITLAAEEKKARQEQKTRDFAKNYGTTSMPKAEAKQVWDSEAKQWIRR